MTNNTNPSGTQAITLEQGLFELTLINAEVTESSFDDVVVEALSRGIPPEIVTRLKDLWEQTKVIAGEIVAIGKIIVAQIFDFLRKNPKLTIGLALGAAVSVLIGGIPLIGGLLQPLATWLGTIYGAGVGAAMAKGDYSGSPYLAAIELATQFFELLKNIFNAVSLHLAS